MCAAAPTPSPPGAIGSPPPQRMALSSPSFVLLAPQALSFQIRRHPLTRTAREGCPPNGCPLYAAPGFEQRRIHARLLPPSAIVTYALRRGPRKKRAPVLRGFLFGTAELAVRATTARRRLRSHAAAGRQSSAPSESAPLQTANLSDRERPWRRTLEGKGRGKAIVSCAPLPTSCEAACIKRSMPVCLARTAASHCRRQFSPPPPPLPLHWPQALFFSS